MQKISETQKPPLGVPYPEKLNKLNEAFRLLSDLTVNCFWGTISFKLESGKIVHVIKEQNIKL